MACSQGAGRDVICGPLVFRRMEFFDAGHVVKAHTHDFDHVTVGVKGLVRVNLKRNGVALESVLLGPGDRINVPADAEHEIVGVWGQSEADCVFVNSGNPRDAF